MNVCRLMCVSVVLIALAGCKQRAKVSPDPGDLPPDTVVATVDGIALTFAEMNERATGFLKYAQDVEGIFFATNLLSTAKEHYRKKAINTFVYKTLLLNEAARRGITVSEQEYIFELQRLEGMLNRSKSSTEAYFSKGPHSPDMMRRDFRDSLVINKLLNQVVDKTVMDEDLDKVVENIKRENAKKRAKLEDARKQILEGASFEDVARAVSEHAASAKLGGDLGEFARGKFEKEENFENAVFSLPVGQVSEIVEGKFGYYLIKVTARNPAQAAKDDVPAVPETVRASHILAKVYLIPSRTDIAGAIYREKFFEGNRALFESLKDKAKLECPLYPDIVYEPPD